MNQNFKVFYIASISLSYEIVIAERQRPILMYFPENDSYRGLVSDLIYKVKPYLSLFCVYKAQVILITKYYEHISTAKIIDLGSHEESSPRSFQLN